MRSDLLDLEMVWHGETHLAVCVSDDGERDSAVWLPKSQIEVSEGSNPKLRTITIPEWLAKDKGLV